jgi:hypothetical protein
MKGTQVPGKNAKYEVSDVNEGNGITDIKNKRNNAKGNKQRIKETK